MSAVIPWTEHEDAIIEQGQKKGLPVGRILEMLLENGSDRTLTATQNRIARLRKKERAGGRKNQKKHGFFWSDEESELMVSLLAEGLPESVVADRINEKFRTNRTEKKIKARVTWLKSRVQRRTPPSGTTAVPLAVPARPVQLPLPENPDRQVRLRYPSGSVVLSIQGTLPPRVQKILSDLVWKDE